MTTSVPYSVFHEASLLHLHTFGINSVAETLIDIPTKEALQDLLYKGLAGPFAILGGGSNMLFSDHYRGSVLRIGLKGIRVVLEDKTAIVVEAAAGEVWDDFVRYCLQKGWYGLENLAAIPGTVGASPIQNVGAYGAEAKDCIATVHAIEIATQKSLTLSRDECRFGYRDSIFKHELAGKCVVTAVRFRLSKQYVPNLTYKAISAALSEEGIGCPTAQQVYDTVTRIRWDKLPKPEFLGSAGSFFKNPIITCSHYEDLRAKFPNITAYESEDKYKVSAAWLIDQCGWRGKRLGHCGVYDKQPLVLVNQGGCSFEEVRQLSDAIASDVESRFGIRLQREAIFNIA